VHRERGFIGDAVRNAHVRFAARAWKFSDNRAGSRAQQREREREREEGRRAHCTSLSPRAPKYSLALPPPRQTMSSSGGARTNDVASTRSRCSPTRSLTTLPPRDGAHQFYRHNQIYRDGTAINFYPVFNAGRNSWRATRLTGTISGSLAVAFTVRFRTIRSSSVPDVILGRWWTRWYRVYTLLHDAHSPRAEK